MARRGDKELLISARHRGYLAAQHDAGTLGDVAGGVVHRLADVGGDRAEIATLGRRINVDDRAHVVV